MLDLDRREFIRWSTAAAAAALVGGGHVGARPLEIGLEEVTVADLQSAMRGGQATSRSITQGYLTRIADIDKRLNSVIELNPDALTIADEMDKERKAGKVRGPLHGIPVLIKDN